MNPEVNEIENLLVEKILPDLEKSRGGFDGIHTLEVVEWLKKIISHHPELELDEAVMIIAAYAHDWGYSDIFKEGDVMDFEKVEGAKALHMELGAKKVEQLLCDDFFDFLSEEQKARAIHLVAVHDKKFELKDTDELVLMEADMLSALYIGGEKPKNDAVWNAKFMEAMRSTRLPKFITEYGKHEAARLVKEREEYYMMN
ncbi:MAG: HD domain-containing protein [Candidatus Moraniibacteriota bacterium]